MYGPKRSFLRPRRRTVRRPGRRGFFVVALVLLASLVTLVAVQLRSLADLETTSAIARTKTLDNLLAAVDQEIRHHLLREAQRALDVPARLFDPECQRDLGTFFDERSSPLVASFFALSEVDHFPGTVYRYGGSSDEGGVVGGEDPMATAILMAVSPHPGRPDGGGDILVDEGAADYRLLHRAIHDATGARVGVVGMVVARDAFLAQVLPAAVEAALPRFDRSEGLVVTARDGMGRRHRVGPGARVVRADLAAPEVERAPTFAFTDWRLGLESRFETPADWARANFWFQASLSVALAVVLAVGVLWTLRGAARATALAEMKSEFVSNVSHELRTPLASIRVFAELLRLGRFGRVAETQEVGEQIESETRRLSELVDRILDFSRIESGRRPYRLTESAPETVLEGVAAAFRDRARADGRAFDVRWPSSPSPDVAMDAEAIGRALGNLVENALKYTPSGSPIEMTLEHDDGKVVFRVADRGPGIPADEQERIFDRFHRVSTGVVHDTQGCGLGLAIVRHVVAAHGGRIDVDSTPGRGACFRLTLPAIAASAPSTARETGASIDPRFVRGVS